MFEPGLGGGPGDLTFPSVTAAPAPTVAAPAPMPTAPVSAGGLTQQQAADLMQYNILPAGQQVPAPELSFFEQGKQLFDKGVDFLTPKTPSADELRAISREAFNAEKAAGMSDLYAQRAADAAVKKATPNIIQKYGPLAAAGLGIMGLAGGFKTPESQRPGLIPTQTGFDLAKMYPERYAVNVPDAVTTYSTTDPYANMYGTPIVRRSAPAAYNPQGANIRRFSDGGSTDYPTDMDEYIPMDGPIDGPGTGTSDSIPAMLSDGEFVFTAKAVRNMGNGSRREGAKRMYALMKQLEEAKNGN
jgi:hypothetical protein